MAQPIVLIVFYSRHGAVETLALATAVGAVQGRALIRMRRLPDPDPTQTILKFPESAEDLRRMHKEYVGPAEADLVAADAIVFASPSDFVPSGLADFFKLHERLTTTGKLEGKVIRIITAPDSSAAPDAIEHATEEGRRLAEMLKSG